MSCRLEINFRRLLQRCEVMAGEQRNGDWRLEKYVGALEEQFVELKKSINPPTADELGEYTQRLEFIKGILHAGKLTVKVMLPPQPSPSAKVMATELLTPISHGSHSTEVKEIHMKVKVKHQTDMRAELLGTSRDRDTEGLRQRHTDNSDNTDIDTLLQHHHQIQERLADEMVLLARNLKENATAAGDIVRKDTKIIENSSSLADTNFGKLTVESSRLEGYTRTCNWWVWLLLSAVIATFLWMIVFMKMFKKGPS